jgi:hypothetical protein
MPSGSRSPGFLTGYRGLTREAYTLDLRQFTGWCRARSLPLFSVRRADIETFARELEARGRARATVTRRLCTIAGFYNYADLRIAAVDIPGRSLGRLGIPPTRSTPPTPSSLRDVTPGRPRTELSRAHR